MLDLRTLRLYSRRRTELKFLECYALYKYKLYFKIVGLRGRATTAGARLLIGAEHVALAGAPDGQTSCPTLSHVNIMVTYLTLNEDGDFKSVSRMLRIYGDDILMIFVGCPNVAVHDRRSLTAVNTFK